MLEVILNLQLTGISHQDSLVLEVKGQVNNAFCASLSLSLSLSLSHTHTHTHTHAHTQRVICHLSLYFRGARGMQSHKPRAGSRNGVNQDLHFKGPDTHQGVIMNQPSSPQGSVLPLLPSHFWEGSSTPTGELRNALFLKLEELPSTVDQEVPR